MARDNITGAGAQSMDHQASVEAAELWKLLMDARSKVFWKPSSHELLESLKVMKLVRMDVDAY